MSAPRKAIRKSEGASTNFSGLGQSVTDWLLLRSWLKYRNLTEIFCIWNYAMENLIDEKYVLNKNGSFSVKGMIIYKNSDKTRFNNHMNNKHNWKWADCGEGREPWVQWRKCDKKLLRKIILVPKKVLPSKMEEVQPGGDQINCQFFLWQTFQPWE